MSQEEKETKADQLSYTVPSSVLCRILGVTDRQIRNLAAEDIVVKAAHGKYKLVESTSNYIAYIKTSKNQSRGNDDELDLDAEKAKHERLKIEQTEMKVKIMRGQLHEAEDVEHVMSNMIAFFKAKVLAIPSKLAPQLTNQHSATNVQRMLMDECRQALEELSEYDPSKFFKSYDDEGVSDDG